MQFANPTSDTISISYGEQTIVLPLDEATDFVMNVIAARKAGYEAKRLAKSEDREIRKAAAAAKKAEKAKAAAKRKAERVKKLRKQLAELEKAA
jgi:hypothetical protein